MDVREKSSDEKRLIDAYVLWRKFESEPWYDNADRDEIALPLVDEAPTVDAVEVVRCREYKFGSWDSEPNDAMVCMRTKDGFWRSGNDFCSFGERKEGADNG